MENFEVETVHAIWCIIITLVVSIGYYVYGKPVMNQYTVRRKLRLQGVKGPVPSLLTGNVPEMKKIQAETLTKSKHYFDFDDNFISQDYSSSLFPYFEHWRKQYGRIYTYSTGLQQHLYLNDPEMVKEISQIKSLKLGRVSHVTKRLKPILGNGITPSNGPHWAHQRRIIAPQFNLDKSKGMVGLMVESVMQMVNKWEEMVKREGENGHCDIRVDDDLKDVSADVIARACFGSSFAKGNQIFSMLKDLQLTLTRTSIQFRLNTFTDMIFGSNKKKQGDVNIKEFEKNLERLIWETVKARKAECIGEEDHKKDLLQLILEEAVRSCDGNLWDKSSYKRFVIDNCKNIYFAGHESTAVTVSWCLMLLALNPNWQNRIREEVLKYCKNGVPDSESISNLKTVTMVIQETMRLYPPAPIVAREAFADINLGNLVVPKGVCIWTLVPTLHRDPEIWGPGANEFKPERFSEGVAKACKYPQAYIPFGYGPRLCLGKHFAMTDVKVILSLIVSKFSFSLSPMYQHSPIQRLLVEPQYGVVIRVVKP